MNCGPWERRGTPMLPSDHLQGGTSATVRVRRAPRVLRASCRGRGTDGVVTTTTGRRGAARPGFRYESLPAAWGPKSLGGGLRAPLAPAIRLGKAGNRDAWGRGTLCSAFIVWKQAAAAQAARGALRRACSSTPAGYPKYRGRPRREDPNSLEEFRQTRRAETVNFGVRWRARDTQPISNADWPWRVSYMGES